MNPDNERYLIGRIEIIEGELSEIHKLLIKILDALNQIEANTEQ